ncbi:MAG: GAF domain-containing protein [Deltaproteobacteria bacterium]|nr:GAF domain-containing protein [Deltaproteobacteria bacterium]
MEHSNRLQTNLRQDLSRLARFGANVVDAHSCFILAPSAVLNQFAETVRLGSSNVDASYRTDVLEVGGFHSLSNSILPGALIPSDSGLIGWVAKHARAIHVSPFEHDSRTLGVYSSDQNLKSFIGIPVSFEHLSGDARLTGVIACDSKKAFAFSKLQGKLLEEFSFEVARIVNLSLEQMRAGAHEQTWGSFIQRAHQLSDALGMNSIEVLRVRASNFDDLEHQLGSAHAIEVVNQVERLIQQALPPHFPLLKLPNGDLLIVVDNMMTSFYETKINAVCGHVAVNKAKLQFEFTKRSWKDKGARNTSLEAMIAGTAASARPIELQQGMMYEHRRA